MQKSNTKAYTKQFIRGNTGTIIIGMVNTVISTAAVLMLARLLQQSLDFMEQVEGALSFNELLVSALITLVVLLATYPLDYLSIPKFISRAMSQYQNYAFEKMTEKGMSSFSKEGASLYISALSNDAAAIETNYLDNIFALIGSILTFIGALAMMFYNNPLLTIISIAISFLPIVVSILTGNKAAKAEKEVSDKNEAYMSSLHDCLMGFDIIKSFKAESQMRKLFSVKVKEVMDAKEFRRKIGIIIKMLSSMSGVLVQLGIFLIGAYMSIYRKDITAGTIVLFIQLLNYVLQPIAQIPQYIAGIKSGNALISKLANAIDENVQNEGMVIKDKLEDKISIKNLTFGYEQDKPILKDINFDFTTHKSYAIVGASGSGKSTLLNLLNGSYRDYDGTISFDDTDLKEIKNDSLYSLLSIIQQNIFIFNASIKDNITMFTEFPKEEIDRAIKLSGLSALVSEKGDTYLCGENGANLSGGEKQRISIARSLLKKSQILLADEATAALDKETAYQVSDAILNLEDMTRIVITHALDKSLLQRYDEIITMKNGEIIECGNFDDLMNQKNYFYSLYTISQ